MDYLFDTQAALWLFTKDSRIDFEFFKDKFVSLESSFIFHQVSTWEIQIKYQLGKLPLPDKPHNFLPKLVDDSGLIYKNIEDKGIFFLERLPEIHRDPFDRLLISHAIINGWTIISSDKTLEKYPVLLELI